MDSKNMRGSALSPIDAKFRRTVLLACDAHYFPFAVLLSTQIATAHPKRDFDITIMINADFALDQTMTDLLEQHSIRVVLFSMPKASAKLKTSKHISVAAYQRIYAPRFLQDDYDRILYLDSDILYQRGDLSRLFDVDLKGRPIGAVRDQLQHRVAGARALKTRIEEVRHEAYFNAGVLLIDTQPYLKQDIDTCVFEEAASDTGFFHDQSPLNAALKNNWAELAPYWNWPSHHRYLAMQRLIKPCFVHFIGPRKPWNWSPSIYDPTHVRTYQTFLSRFAPSRLRNVRSWKETALAAGFRLIAKLRGRSDRRRIAPYLAGFQDEWDVK